MIIVACAEQCLPGAAQQLFSSFVDMEWTDLSATMKTVGVIDRAIYCTTASSNGCAVRTAITELVAVREGIRFHGVENDNDWKWLMGSAGRKNPACPALAGISGAHDKGGHDLPLMVKFRYVGQSFMPLCTHLGRGGLAQGCRRKSSLFGRQLTITRQPSTAQTIRHSCRHPSSSRRKKSEVELHGFFHPR